MLVYERKVINRLIAYYVDLHEGKAINRLMAYYVELHEGKVLIGSSINGLSCGLTS